MFSAFLNNSLIFSISAWLENNQQPCLVKKSTGLACPGCGFQTSLIALADGRVVDSFMAYPPLIPFLFTLVFLGLHLYFRFRTGARILVGLFVLTSALIVVNFVIKSFFQ
mgnify:CR=1 FL=1